MKPNEVSYDTEPRTQVSLPPENKKNPATTMLVTSLRRTQTIRFTQTRRASHKIVYTYTDEAPMLATYSLLPIIRRFTEPAKIQVDLRYDYNFFLTVATIVLCQRRKW